jgi:hypothetical protein
MGVISMYPQSIFCNCEALAVEFLASSIHTQALMVDQFWHVPATGYSCAPRDSRDSAVSR